MRSKRSLLTTIALSVLSLGMVTLSGPVARGQVASCPVSASDQTVDDQEQRLLVLINQYRAANGRPALSFQTDVVRAASWFSRDMAAKNYFPANHVDSNNRTVPQRLTWCGARYSNWAENIFAGRSDAQSTFDAWRNSSGHNSNMLRTGVTSAGIARANNPSSRYGWYWTLDVTDSSGSSPTTTAVSPTTTRLPSVTTTTPQVTTTRPVTTSTTLPRATTTTVPRTTPTCPPQYAVLCSRFG